MKLHLLLLCLLAQHLYGQSVQIYDSVPFKGGQLSVIINKPLSSEKHPALLIIPGYTCASIDQLPKFHPYQRIVDAFDTSGFVVFRIEKSGLGKSSNTPSCSSCDLLDEIKNFELGLLKLKTLPFVDTNQIILFGHSMGGIIAPALSAKHNVAGVAVYGTTAKSWFEYQLEMFRVQSALAGISPEQIDHSIRDQYSLNYGFFIQKKSLSELTKDKTIDSILKTEWLFDGKDQIFGRNNAYWRQIQDFPHYENWRNTKAKVLVMHGTADFQAFSLSDHEEIVKTVNISNSGNAKLISFLNTDHYFANNGDMQIAYNLFAQQKYKNLFDNYNKAVGDSLVKWAKQVLYQNTENQKESRPRWEQLTTESYPGKQDDIVFSDAFHGWYVNGYGAIYKTIDGGLNWEKIYEQKGTFYRCITFLDSLNGFVGTVGTDYFPNVTDTIPLYRTQDGGLTWSPVSYKGPYVKGLCAFDVVDEPFINHGILEHRKHIYAVGRVGGPVNLMVSHDNGETWLAQPVKSGQMLFDIHMMDTKVGLACSASSADVSKSHALMLRTTDGGKTWKKVYESKRPYETTWKMSFPTNEIGYATIQSYNPDTSVSQQRIIQTRDGGIHWQEVALVNNHQAREFGIGFIDAQHGFVGTLKSGFETTDGGITWRPIDLGIACNKIRFYHFEHQKPFGISIGKNVFKYHFN
jgi:photosystem II stability/assembly factor-like uncharacterized protein/pimeloyl-ACP methyl ester carboxylesterase